MQLSHHFALDEFCRSDAAVRLGIDMTPPPVVVDSLTDLATNVLEPLRAFVGKPIHVSSGYRPAQLNQVIGGAPNSQHVQGQAADIEVDGMTPLQLCHAVMSSGVPFDQLILEFGWVHVSYSPGGAQRREILTARSSGGKVVYLEGLQP